MFSRYEAAASSLLPVIGMASDGYGDRAIMVVMMVRWLIPRAGLCVCVVKYGSCWRYLAEIGYTWLSPTTLFFWYVCVPNRPF